MSDRATELLKFVFWQEFHGEGRRALLDTVGITPRGNGKALFQSIETSLIHNASLQQKTCLWDEMMAMMNIEKRQPNPFSKIDEMPLEQTCRCGRPLIGWETPDPWCSGCSMSASTCDCAQQIAGAK